MKHSITILAVCVLVLSIIATAQVPQKISYQGLLTTSVGTPVQDGSYNLRFDIYNLPSGGTLRYTQTQNGVSVTRGTFSVILGPLSAIFNESLYVQVTALAGSPGISSDITFLPRSELTSAPYALSAWNLTGNAGTTAGTDFVGTTDAQALDIRTNNVLRTRITTEGRIETYNTGQSVFVGEGAGANDDLSDNYNVFVGYRAGFSNTTGYYNTANGWRALYSNTTGSGNTANGSDALLSNTTGNNNTANGVMSLSFNTTGSGNTANGTNALYSNTSGWSNTANGMSALHYNTSGWSNTANGSCVLWHNTTGSWNTANGYYALFSNTSGNGNAAHGNHALYSNTTGFHNTAIGDSADVTSGSLSNATAIGYNARVSASNTMVFGDSNVIGWGFGTNPGSGKAIEVGTSTSNGNGAYLTTGGTWTNASDRNAKENITSVDGQAVLEKLEKLPIYKWNYKNEDPSFKHVGPMAQDFYAIFGLGNDDKTISTIDPAGVALAAIQALGARIAELEEMVKVLTEERKGAGEKSLGEVR